MATPAALRTAITELGQFADRDMRGLWGQVRTPDQAREALQDVLPDLVRTYRSASATITADWYDDLRDQIEAKGRFRAFPVDDGELGVDKLAGWGVGPLYQAKPDWSRAEVLVSGGIQLRIAAASRKTIMQSSIEDPAAAGWQREGAGACAFCAMLIGRGAVYSEATADFGAHDHCNCSAVPAFKGQPTPVKAFTPSAKKVSDADRARVRDWIAANHP